MYYLGPNVLLAKMDISEAYRSPYTQRITSFGRPVAGLYPYRLSAGLQSAPAIFSALSEALEWVLRKCSVIYYMDVISPHEPIGM